MPDDLSARLIVMDTGPLITLAAADSLDYLLYPGVPVYIPDAVLYEATRDAAALGAAEILDWAQQNSDAVRTISTETFFNYVESREALPSRRERDLGERAAIEAIHDGIQLAAEERAILITEDDRVLRRVLVTNAELTAKMIPITTRDFLEAMQEAQRINSVEEVYRRAEDAGRLASRRAALGDQHEQARAAVDKLLRRSRQGRDNGQ
ncbi:MAG: hypothetical protein JO209_06060 [Acidisphaera sp.]|nr:hypothetical protein [Acidisphaera sp.]